MANIFYRLSHTAGAPGLRKFVGHNSLLCEHTDRLPGHLAASDLNLDNNRVTLGPVLTFDDKRRHFTGEASEYANMFLKRLYRPSFVVPEDV